MYLVEYYIDFGDFGRVAGCLVLSCALLLVAFVFLKRDRKFKKYFIIAAIGVAAYAFFPDLVMEIVGTAVGIGIIFFIIKMIIKR